MHLGFVSLAPEAVLEFMDLFDFPDEAAEGAGTDGLAGVVTDAFLWMNVGFDAESIRSIGHGCQGTCGDIFNVADRVGGVHDYWSPTLFF